VVNQVKAVFFDAAGTLFTVRGSVGEIYCRIAHKHGKEVEVKDLEAGFRRCFSSAPPLAFPHVAPERLAELEKRWWHDLVWQIFAPLGPFPGFAEYFTELFSFFARAEAWQLYPETLETLAALRKREFVLGVISNFDSRLFGLLQGLGIGGFFASVIISSRAGYAKPAPEIFSQALQEHRLRPDQAIHIGDSRHADIAGARAAGLLPILIDRREGEVPSNDCQRVKSLKDLLTLLE
jgi:putative hydrolase of the HAD superfamily